MGAHPLLPALVTNHGEGVDAELLQLLAPEHSQSPVPQWVVTHMPTGHRRHFKTDEDITSSYSDGDHFLAKHTRVVRAVPSFADVAMKWHR